MINAMMSDTSLQTVTPQQSARLLIDAVRRKARDRGLADTISLDAVVAMCEVTHCPATGVEFDMRRGLWLPNRQALDRIDTTDGYHEYNVRVVTNIFNQSKSCFPEEIHDEMCLGRA
jgi:hypothetical protein